MTFRNFRLSAALGIGLLLGAAGAVFGQAGLYQIVSPTGLEQVLVNSTSSAYNNFVQLNTLRNTTGYLLTSTATGTVSPTMTLAADNVVFTAALTAGVTLPLPASPPDGYIMSVVNGTGSPFSFTITLTTSDGSTFGNGSTAASLASAASQEWQYTAAGKIWYRMR